MIESGRLVGSLSIVNTSRVFSVLPSWIDRIYSCGLAGFAFQCPSTERTICFLSGMLSDLISCSWPRFICSPIKGGYCLAVILGAHSIINSPGCSEIAKTIFCSLMAPIISPLSDVGRIFIANLSPFWPSFAKGYGSLPPKKP